jgi:hypothetical protein
LLCFFKKPQAFFAFVFTGTVFKKKQGQELISQPKERQTLPISNEDELLKNFIEDPKERSENI